MLSSPRVLSWYMRSGSCSLEHIGTVLLLVIQDACFPGTRSHIIITWARIRYISHTFNLSFPWPVGDSGTGYTFCLSFLHGLFPFPFVFFFSFRAIVPSMYTTWACLVFPGLHVLPGFGESWYCVSGDTREFFRMSSSGSKLVFR